MSRSPTPRRRATLASLAAELKVSRTTVSNAYNRPDQLSADLRERVLATAKRLGYPGPDPVARSLRTRRAGAVGLMITDWNMPRMPGIDLLRDLIETVQARPDITTAGLLERWRHHAEGRHLGKLAAVEMPPPEDFDPAAELAECLAQLAAAGLRERIQVLIEKERLGSASEDEKAELRTLVAERRTVLN